MRSSSRVGSRGTRAFVEVPRSPRRRWRPTRFRCGVMIRIAEGRLLRKRRVEVAARARAVEELLLQATSGDVAAERREITIEGSLSLGDTIVVRTTTRVTHAATGTRLVTPGMIWARIEGGMIVEGWGEYDRLGQLQQLGVVPEDAELRAWAKERLGERGGAEERG